MEETTTDSADVSAISEERLRLEREALVVERERLAAARARVEAEAAMESKRSHPFLVASSVVMLALLSFAGGLLAGMAIMEGRQEALREKRLARALSQLDGFATGAGSATSNSLPVKVGAKTPEGAHRNVAVMVIQ